MSVSQQKFAKRKKSLMLIALKTGLLLILPVRLDIKMGHSNANAI